MNYMKGTVTQMAQQPSSKQEKETPATDEAKGSRGTMLMRSTGLGKTELLAEIVGLKRQGDYLIMEVHTISPVHWKIRSGLSRKDLWMLIKALMNLSIISFLFDIGAWFKEPKHPGEY